MKFGSALLAGVLFIFMIGCAFPGYAADTSTIQLPSPQREGGKPLMTALNERMSTRAFSGEKLPMQTLSNLLWAAFGINRPDGKRTAPSAKNWQEMDIYVVAADGAYVYDAKKNALDQILKTDIRAATGLQPFVKDASVNLVFVADYAKTDAAGNKEILIGADAGFIGQNVYLFCASEGLVTVVRANVDVNALGKELKLRPDQKIILTQSVGYPKK